MVERRSSRGAWVIWGVAMLLFLGALTLVGQTWGRARSQPPAIVVESTVIVAGYTTLGALIAARRPRNPFGWVVLVGGALGAVQIAADAYADLAFVSGPEPLPGASIAAWLSEWTFFPHVVLSVVFPFFLFPTGRPHARRWRGALVVPGAAAGLLTFARAFAPAFDDFGIDNPLHVQRLEGVADAAGALGLNLLLVSVVMGVVALVARFRASRGAERQQMKWFAYGASLMGLFLLVMFTVPTLTGAPIPPPIQMALLLSLLAIPITAAIGILRYRLYDIDVVISRTVTYGALALVVTAIYVAVVALLGTALGGGSEPSLARSILATAVVAIAFHPLRERLQRMANRLVYGPRATPYETLASFSHRVSSALSLDEALPRIAEAAARGVGAEHARVCILLDGSERVTTWPAGAEGEVDYRLPVEHQGEVVGEIGVAKARGDEVRPAEAALLRDLASQAGLAMRNVRLTLELQARLDEISRQAQLLRESRARLVTAQEVERRRLERNLHDGAQQNLVSLSGQLRLLADLLRSSPERAADLAEALVGEADSTLDEIRNLARGIFPKILADKGLVPALRAHMTKHIPSGELLYDPDAEHRRLDPDTESAIYFCCIEALQNAGKYARGAPVVVSVQLDDESLRFSVADSGPGFDPARIGDGTGLLGIADRVAALGGAASIDSSVGRGTVVSGVVPLGDRASLASSGF